MMTLRQWIDENAAGEPKAVVADRLGISRSYLTEILAGTKPPGRGAIIKIERATAGKVPAAVWFQSERAA